jgi:hypothetical protein
MVELFGLGSNDAGGLFGFFVNSCPFYAKENLP